MTRNGTTLVDLHRGWLGVESSGFRAEKVQDSGLGACFGELWSEGQGSRMRVQESGLKSREKRLSSGLEFVVWVLETTFRVYFFGGGGCGLKLWCKV